MNPSLLIASPQMKDPFFERAVVLVWQHDADGAIGVVVNKLLEHTLPDVLDLDEVVDLTDYIGTPVVWGGPVESDSGTVITRGEISEDEGQLLPSGLGVTQSQDALLRLLGDGASLMLCLGYAGWGPGQLEREIELGSWLWTDCDAGIVFTTPPELRYDKALASLGLTAAMVWMQPVHE